MQKNGTSAGRWVVKRGVTNAREMGTAVSYNGETEAGVWKSDECDRFVGTDSTIFPPFLKKEEGLWAYSPELCRSMGAYFTHRSSYNGVPTYMYKMDFGDVKNDEHLRCFCPKYPERCPLKGTMDLSPCVRAPLVASKPHFYGADPILLHSVDGLTPNETEHDIFIHFEIVGNTFY
jgi:hypothetical protein